MIKKYNLPVEGMTCASCVARVEKVMKKFEGLENVAVNFASEKVSFDADNIKVDLKAVAKEIEEYGYNLKLEEENIKASKDVNNDTVDKHYKELKINFLFALILTIPLFIISMAFDMNIGWFKSIWKFDLEQTQKILLILTTPIMFVSAKDSLQLPGLT